MYKDGFMIVTPQIAQEMLKHNSKNRTVRRHTVDAYARDMKKGFWVKNGEPIVFSKNGELKNGQHRLYAIIKADVPIEVYIVTGVPDSVTTYDRGAKRTINDEMAFEGYPTHLRNGCAVPTARYLIELAGCEKVTDAETKAFMAQFDDEFKLMYALYNVKSHGKIQRNAQIMAALLCAKIDGVDTGILYRFVDVLTSGLYNGQGETPAIVLRNQLVFGMKRSTRLERKTMFNAVQEALNDFAVGKARIRAYTGTKGIYYDKTLYEIRKAIEGRLNE